MNASATVAMESPNAAATDALRRAAGPSLLGSFGIASLIVIVGVLGSWVAVKRGGAGVDAIAADLAMDDLPTALVEDARISAGASLVDRGDVAFAAGRVVAPRFDNALYFYRSALEEDTNDTLALAGLERVELWLEGQLETAIAEQRFDRANELAGMIADMRPEDVALVQRMADISRIQELIAKGTSELESGRYVSAATTFRALLAIDAGSVFGRDGLRSAVDALVNAGMAAANEGDLETARARLAEARRADGRAAGLATLAERIEAVDSAPVVAGPEELVARAREAIAADRLFGLDGNDAFALIAAIRRGFPGDPVIPGLQRDAEARLVALGGRALAADDLDAMRRVLDRATELGMDTALFGDLGDEISYRAYMADFAQRNWQIRRISELQPIVQQPPELGRRAQRLGSGYVDVEFTVDTEGRVADAIAIASTTPAFEEPSLEAIQAWRFEPITVGGRPVPARAVMRFSFVQ